MGDDESADEFLRLEAEAAEETQPATLPLPLPLPPPRPPARPLRQAGLLPKAMPAEPGRPKPALRDRPADASSERIERLAQSMRTSADRDLWDEQRRGSRSEQEALRAQQRQKTEGQVEFLRNLKKVNALGRCSVDFKKVGQGKAVLRTAEEHERAEQDRALKHEKEWREREPRVLRSALRQASPQLDSANGRGLDDLRQPITASSTSWRAQKKREKHAEIVRGFVHKEHVDVEEVVDRLYKPALVDRKPTKGSSHARAWQLSMRTDHISDADMPSVLVKSSTAQLSFRPETASRLHLQAANIRKKRDMDANQPRAEETWSPSIPSTSRKLAERSESPLRRSRSVPARSSTPLRRKSPGRSPTQTPKTPLRSLNSRPRRPADISDEVAKAVCYCATWVACHGDEFEEIIKQKNSDKEEWKFLTETDSAAYVYYQRRIQFERSLTRGTRRPITVRAAPQQQVRPNSREEALLHRLSTQPRRLSQRKRQVSARGRDAGGSLCHGPQADARPQSRSPPDKHESPSAAISDDGVSDLVHAAERAKSDRLSSHAEAACTSPMQPSSVSPRRAAASTPGSRPSIHHRKRRSTSAAKQRLRGSDQEQEERRQRMAERPWRSTTDISVTPKKRQQSRKVSPPRQLSTATSAAERQMAALLVRKKAAVAAENFEEAALIKRQQDALLATMPDLSEFLQRAALSSAIETHAGTAASHTLAAQSLSAAHGSTPKTQLNETGVFGAATTADPESEPELQLEAQLKLEASKPGDQLHLQLEPRPEQELQLQPEPEPALEPLRSSAEVDTLSFRQECSGLPNATAAPPTETAIDPAQQLAQLAPAVADKARTKTSPGTVSGHPVAPPRPSNSAHPAAASQLSPRQCRHDAVNVEAQVAEQIAGSSATLEHAELAQHDRIERQALFSRWEEKDIDFVRGSHAIEATLQTSVNDNNEESDISNGDDVVPPANEEERGQENDEGDGDGDGNDDDDEEEEEEEEEDFDDDEQVAEEAEEDSTEPGFDLDDDWLTPDKDDDSDDPFAMMDDVLEAAAADAEVSDDEHNSEDDFAKLEALLDSGQ